MSPRVVIEINYTPNELDTIELNDYVVYCNVNERNGEGKKKHKEVSIIK